MLKWLFKLEVKDSWIQCEIISIIILCISSFPFCIRQPICAWCFPIVSSIFLRISKFSWSSFRFLIIFLMIFRLIWRLSIVVSFARKSTTICSLMLISKSLSCYSLRYILTNSTNNWSTWDLINCFVDKKFCTFFSYLLKIWIIIFNILL